MLATLVRRMAYGGFSCIYPDGKLCKNQFSTFEGLDEGHAPGTLQKIFNTYDKRISHKIWKIFVRNKFKYSDLFQNCVTRL